MGFIFQNWARIRMESHVSAQKAVQTFYFIFLFIYFFKHGSHLTMRILIIDFNIISKYERNLIFQVSIINCVEPFHYFFNRSKTPLITNKNKKYHLQLRKTLFTINLFRQPRC